MRLTFYRTGLGHGDDVEVFVEHFGLGSFVATVKFVLHAVAVGFAMTPRHEVACTHFRTGKAERHQSRLRGFGRALGLHVGNFENAR